MSNYKRPLTTDINSVRDDIFYRSPDLQAILKNIGLNSSMFSILDAETWRCSNLKCERKRYKEEILKCPKCKGAVITPIIKSRRTFGSGKGVGNRIYSGIEIKEIVEIFKQRGHHSLGAKVLFLEPTKQ